MLERRFWTERMRKGRRRGRCGRRREGPREGWWDRRRTASMHSYSRAQSTPVLSSPPPLPPSLPPPPPPVAAAAEVVAVVVVAVVVEEEEEEGREGGLERACTSFKISRTSWMSREGWREGRHSSVVCTLTW